MSAYVVTWPPKTVKGWLVLIGSLLVGGAAVVVFGVVLLAVLGVLLITAPFLVWWARRRLRKAQEQFADGIERPGDPRPPAGPRVIDVDAEVGPPTE